VITASYARFSTDKQRLTSIEDQQRAHVAWCDRMGVEQPRFYADEAMSAALPLASRPGAAAMLADAVAGRFQVLLLEALDRLSRDLPEQERIVRRLEFMGIRIVGLSDGYDSHMGMRKINRIARGMVNEMYIDDLRQKTHRGLTGQIERGFIASGKVYGYRIEREERGSRYAVDEAQAAVVRRIFTDVAAGASVQSIAHALNAERAPAPRGGTWAASALYGSPAKGSGILNNELYTGTLIWNRSQWIKNPDSGRRQRRDRPRSEWQVVARPELRVVDDALWQAVRGRFKAPAAKGGIQGRGRRPTSLFGGQLVCAKCGGSMVVTDGRVYSCAARKDRGPSVCVGTAVRRDLVDRRVLGALRESLLSPASLAAYEREITAILRADARPQDNSRRIAELGKEIDRMVDAIAAIGHSDALRARLQCAEEERHTLLRAAAEAKVDAPAPTATELVADYRELVMNLEGAISGDDVTEAREILRELFGPLMVRQHGEEIWVETSARPAAGAAVSNGVQIGMVAGTGNLICLLFRAV
jgi:DNA invertase Pin-like site-specific DNA recombinase